MQCAEFEERLNQLLDERRPLQDERLQEHARECASCAELLALEPLIEAVASTPGVLPPDFAARTVALARQAASTRLSESRWVTLPAASATPGRTGDEPIAAGESVRSRGRRGWRRMAVTALTVVLVAAALIPALRHAAAGRVWAVRGWSSPVAKQPGRTSGRRGAGAGMFATVHPRARVNPPSETASAGKSFSDPQALGGPQSLSDDEADELRQLLVKLWTNIPRLPQERFEPIDRIAGGIRPLASSLSGAWGALRRSFPGNGGGGAT